MNVQENIVEKALLNLIQICSLILLVLLLFHQKARAQEPSTKVEIQSSSKKSVSEFELWPKGLPADAIPLADETIRELKAKSSPEGHLYYVESPTLSVYLADPAKANGCGVVICPGGGYHILAWQHEGVELAKWFNSIGVSAFILKYRIPRRNPEKIYWEPLQDVQRAIRLVRHRAAEYELDPNRIGTLGFSAGGHLTVMSGLQSETVTYPAVDEADAVSCRPNFICPIYAAYLAENEKDDTAALGPLVKVTKNSPPAFMAVTWDDSFRGAQSALLFVELKKNGVPAELHAYSQGGHGYGIRPSENPVSQWHNQLEAWLKVSGFLQSK